MSASRLRENFSIRALLTILIGGLVLTQGYADPLQGIVDQMPSKVGQFAKWVMSVTPERYVQGAREYLSMTGTNINGGSNSGIQQYNERLLNENQCLRDLASHYYASFYEQTADQLLDLVENGHGGLNVLAPHIGQSVKDAGMKPGWLWGRTLKFANGDANLAVTLLGLCGHDDSNQLVDSRHFDAPDTLARVNARFEEVKGSPKIDEKLVRAAKWLNQNNTGISMEPNELLAGLEDYFRRGVNCPGQTFYLPQSLGEEVDIPQSLKDRIVRVQAPTMGAKVIKAKAYHTIAGVVSGCRLVQNRVPSFVSEMLVKFGVNGYRAGRLCSSKMTMGPVGGMKNALPDDPEKLFEVAKKFRSEGKPCFTIRTENSAGSKITTTELDYTKGPLCDVGALLPYRTWFDPDLSDEILRKKIYRRAAESDVSTLFKSSPEFSLANECNGPQYTQAVYAFLMRNSNGLTGAKCPESWSEKRCQSARDVMATYAVDFEWSEAQQIAGLKFAQKVCSPPRPGYSMEKSACEALAKVRQSANAPAGRSSPNDVIYSGKSQNATK